MGATSKIADAFRMTDEAWKRHATVFGAVLIVLAQLWRIDRLAVLYDSTR